MPAYGGWRDGVDCRAVGWVNKQLPDVLASVNLVPLLWTGVPTPSAPADRQDPLPIFRCPGNASMLRRVFRDHLITGLFRSRWISPRNKFCLPHVS